MKTIRLADIGWTMDERTLTTTSGRHIRKTTRVTTPIGSVSYLDKMPAREALANTQRQIRAND